MRFQRPVFLPCLAFCVGLVLTGCSFRNPIESVEPYRLAIPQGNVVSEEMLAKLKPGMTRTQVKFVLGTPLVRDAFHPDRWDYFYSMQKNGKTVEQRRVTVIFEGDVFKGLSGDIVPERASKANAPKAAPPAGDEAPAATISGGVGK